MTASTSRSLVFSILIHGSVVAVALLLMLPASREQVIVPQAFEIFPGSAQSQSHAPSNPATSGPAVKFPVVPVPVPRQSVPVAETVDDPAQQPVPAHRVPPPVVRTTPERPSPRMTAAEFQRQHPSAARPSSAGLQSAPLPSRIDIGNVLAPTGESSSSTSSAAVDENLSADYLARLMGKLRVAHEKPAGLDAGLKARVEFVLRADGTIGDVRIVKSSGSAVFDASVLAAFRMMHDLGAPPAGIAGVNQVTFRTSED